MPSKKKKRAKQPDSRKAQPSIVDCRSICAVLCDSAKSVSQDDFDTWADYLRRRKKPGSATKHFPHASTAPLGWGLPSDVLGNSYLSDLIKDIGKLKKAKPNARDLGRWHDRIEQWIADRDTRANGATDALECLAWAYATPKLTSYLDAQTWRDLVGQLLKTVEEAEVGREHTNGWSQLLASGELPLVLAHQLSEIPDCCRLAKPASQFVSQCMEQWFDGRGFLHAKNLAHVRPLLATLTRSIRLSRDIRGTEIRKSALAEFDWFVQHALRLTRCDLSSAMTPVDDVPRKKSFKDLFQSALSLTKDEQDSVLLDCVLHANSPKSAPLPDDDDLPEEPSYQSDWSDAAVLQPEWSPQGPRLVVVHAEKELRGEFSIGKEIVFAGDLMPSVKIDGKLTTVQEEWECVCWFADEDVDMLEIRTNLSNGWKLERQFLMARDDQFLLVADVLTGDHAASIEYQNELPLCGGITFEPSAKTAEGYLSGKSKLGLVMPLSLPEWRSGPGRGILKPSERGLALQISAAASSLYAPLFIDLHRRRMRATPTWRQLTISDQLRTVGPDEAVGYRVQAGIEQWLIYRSLRPTISRTVLGQHLSDEFVCGRFLNDGTIESLVEIASSDPNSIE